MTNIDEYKCVEVEDRFEIKNCATNCVTVHVTSFGSLIFQLFDAFVILQTLLLAL